MLYNTNMSNKYKSNKNITYSCKYHVVWCQKYRRKVLIKGVDNRDCQLFGQTVILFQLSVVRLFQ